MTTLLTLAEVATRLRVSRRTVQRLVASGQLRVVKVASKSLVTDAEVEAFVAAAFRRVA